ncbi:MAG: DUF262 domain-containing protein [Ignavibacteria bacterium]
MPLNEKLENQISLKTVFELVSKKFIVPSYQRGYRWTSPQVTELLDDLYDFFSNPPKQEEGKEKPFYCLQPIVVKKSGEEWEVIDGQQRLTTLYIILSYFNNKVLKTPQDIFQLHYQTRKDSQSFLKNINRELRDNNIDYLYICDALDTVESWFKGKQKIYTFYDTIVYDTKFIWYEVNDEVEPIDIFTRINIGKIPLTNAELIKALFLQKGNFQNAKPDNIHLKQLQIASEWDKIEYTLQKESFWYFINDNKTEYYTRIEFIFDLMCKKEIDYEDYYTFHYFNNLFVNGQNINDLWKLIKKYFMTFEDWYNDHHIYHLVGFLIASGFSIQILKEKSNGLSKKIFMEFINEEIKSKLDYDFEELEELNYNKDSKIIRTILLLFNIQTILSNNETKMLFPFDKFKNGFWDLEHIRSKKSINLEEKNSRKYWFEVVLQDFTGVSSSGEEQNNAIELLKDDPKVLCKEILSIVTSDNYDNFESVYSRALQYYQEDNEPDNIDSLSNLTLLDSKTNRGYKNAVFQIKRKTIINNDINGTFIPICTRNVFLKYYTKGSIEIAYWKENDASDYLDAIKTKLSKYSTKKSNSTENENN